MHRVTEPERFTLAIVGTCVAVSLGAVEWKQGALFGQRGTPVSRSQATRWDEAIDHARRVDVNAADHAELEELPEIGPTLASRILAYRMQHGRFQRLEDLTQVPGIGPKTIEAMKDYVTVE